MDTGRVLRAGIIASIVMAMIEMIYEAVAGAGFWSPVVLIGATVLRGLQSLQAPVAFHFGGVVLGLMGHMMNSVILGFIFARFFSRSAKSGQALVGVGAVYALAVFVIMWYVVVPAVDPVMRQLNGTAFGIAHIMWGAVLGWFVSQPAGTTAY